MNPGPGQNPDETRAAPDLWAQTLVQLRTMTKRSVVESWFARIALVGQTEAAVHLGVPDEPFRDYVSVHFLEAIRRTVQSVAARPIEVHLVVAPDAPGGRFAPGSSGRAGDLAGLRREALQSSGQAPGHRPIGVAARGLAVVEPAISGALPTAAGADLAADDPAAAAPFASPLPYDAETTAGLDADAMTGGAARGVDGQADRPAPGRTERRRATDRAEDAAAALARQRAARPLQGGLALEVAAGAPDATHEAIDRFPDDGYAQDGAAVEALSARFTFDAFVIGAANQLPASAARSVAETPGTVFNPLFLHGGVGLGKTHLLHAIGHAARQRTPGLRVRYVATETFIEDTHTAWRSKDPGARTALRNHYRNEVDLLLVDDIQFLQKRAANQEEFFHLFNTLHQAGKQIVLTCDRYPSELQEFHDRLRSRFDWGLVAELLPPERDLRAAILRRKAAEARMDLPHDVTLYLADHLRNNVRELEGALNKLAAHSRIGQRAIDLALARSVLGPMIELPSRHVTVEVIQRLTAQHFSLKITDLKGTKRHRNVVLPRMIAVHLTRKHTQLSYPDIGRAFGGRDHSTIIHACQKIEWLLTTDPAVQAAAAAIETALGK